MYNYNYPGYAGSGYQIPQPAFNAYNTQPQTAQSGLKGRPVSSLEEAKVANIDFDGSLFIFPDIVNRKIYTKQINADGSPAFRIYTLDESASDQPPAYVTKEELDEAITSLKESLVVEKKPQPQINF